MSQLNFDASTHKPSDPSKGGFEPLEPGWYKMKITESEVKTTKSGSGTYLALTLEGLDGEGKGRKVWDRINLTNPNEVCVRIGKRMMGDLCHAISVLKPSDSNELHNKPLGVKLTVREWEYEGQKKRSNDVKAYCAIPDIPDTPQSTTEVTIPPPPTGADPYKS